MRKATLYGNIPLTFTARSQGQRRLHEHKYYTKQTLPLPQDYPFKCRHFLNLLQHHYHPTCNKLWPPGHCIMCFPPGASQCMRDTSQHYLTFRPQQGAAIGMQHSWADVNLQQSRVPGLFITKGLQSPPAFSHQHVPQQHPSSLEASCPQSRCSPGFYRRQSPPQSPSSYTTILQDPAQV